MTDTTQVTEAIGEHSRSFFTRALTFILALPLRIAVRPLLWLPRIAAAIILMAIKRAFRLVKLALSLPIPGQSGRHARGVVAAAAAGAGAAYLLDPESGPKRREQLRERGIEAGQQAASVATQKVREATGGDPGAGGSAPHSEPSATEPSTQTTGPAPEAAEPERTGESPASEAGTTERANEGGAPAAEHGFGDAAAADAGLAQAAEAMAETPAGGGGA